MNRIYVVDDFIKEQNLDDTITLEVVEKNDFFSVNRIKLHILKDTTLFLECHASEEIKLDFFIKVDPNVTFTLNEIKTGCRAKVQYKYYLEEYSNTRIEKFYNAKKVRELDVIHLNGIGATIKTRLKTIATSEEKYDMTIYHNAQNTESDIINHGVSILEGKLTFDVTTMVPKGKKSCIANQMGRIINLNDKKSTVKPNLFIDEFDVEANHAALIGKFQDEELFYLQSRGLNKKEATSLLIKGFLCSHLEESKLREKIEQLIKQYWR